MIRRGEGGAPRQVVGIVENITRQKEMELALLEARSRDGLTPDFTTRRPASGWSGTTWPDGPRVKMA